MAKGFLFKYQYPSCESLMFAFQRYCLCVKEIMFTFS